jgi:hypothetical protein
VARTFSRYAIIMALAVGLIWTPGAPSQSVPRPDPRYRPYPYPPAGSLQPAAPRLTPKLEPIAETKLLMEGLTNANFRGLERLLRQKPADVQAWTFARGQALLIAETANLLMLRPPRGQGQAAWFERAMDLRRSATDVGRAAAAQDYGRSRSAFVELANSCNRCHQAFRVNVEIIPFQDAPAGPPGAKTSLAP